ncbi:MAG: PAS domain S-box protein [Halobacterium sp.]
MSRDQSADVRVLHVDDDGLFVETASEFVERASPRLDVSTATSASEALDRLDSTTVDCVVSDYDMPDMDGLAFLAAVREDYPELPFILYTSDGSEELASDAMAAGVTDYLRKRPGTEQYRLLAHRIESAVDRRRARTSYREIFEKAADGILLHDPETGAITDANRRIEDLLGYSREELRSMDVGDFSAGEPFTQTEAERRIDRVRREGSETFEWLTETKAGDERWVEVHLKRTAIDDRERVLASFRDISERKERQRRIEALHESTRQLMGAESEADVARLTARAAEETLNYRSNVVRLVDDEQSELVPVAVTDLAREEMGPRPVYPVDETPAGRAYERGEPVVCEDTRDIDDDYSRGDAHSVMYLPIGEYGTISIADTTLGAFGPSDLGLAQILTSNATAALDRVTHERKLRRYESMVDTARDMVYMLDLDGRFRFVNDAALDLTGYDRDQLVGAHVSLVMDSKDVQRGRDLIHGLLDSEAPSTESDAFEWTLHTADGEEVDCESHIALLYEDGELGGTVGVVRDVTEYKERERLLERQNDRLNEFAGVIAHDLRNPLNVSRGRVELAADECDCEHLDGVARALDRMNDIVEDTLTLARNGHTVGETELVDLSRLLVDCWEHVDVGDADLRVDEGLLVRADPDRLRHLFENLFRNAVEHGAASTVRAGMTDGVLFVEDDGDGLSAAADDVFDAGYSTAGDSGLGLAIVKRVVEAHGWEIRATDGRDGGARFEITGVERPSSQGSTPR